VDCSQPQGKDQGRTPGGLTAVAVPGVLINNCWFFGKGRNDRSRYFNPAAAQPMLVSYSQPRGLKGIPVRTFVIASGLKFDVYLKSSAQS